MWSILLIDLMEGDYVYSKSYNYYINKIYDCVLCVLYYKETDMNNLLKKWCLKNASNSIANNNQLTPTKIFSLEDTTVDAKAVEKEADFLYFQEEYTEAKSLYLKAIKLFANNKAEAVESYYGLARIYHIQYDFNKALEYYNECYQITESTNDKAGLLKHIITNISILMSDKELISTP